MLVAPAIWALNWMPAAVTTANSILRWRIGVFLGGCILTLSWEEPLPFSSVDTGLAPKASDESPELATLHRKVRRVARGPRGNRFTVAAGTLTLRSQNASHGTVSLKGAVYAL